ncbi:hypothetical protein C8F01DRAFT_1090071 [Mycena amicta]|nr:hypothetical protein C8F01DRAFT_1090071 [Mycena amicta]
MREKQNKFLNGAAILGGRSLEKGVRPGRNLHNPSLGKRQRRVIRHSEHGRGHRHKQTRRAGYTTAITREPVLGCRSNQWPEGERLLTSGGRGISGGRASKQKKVKRTNNAEKKDAHYTGKSDTRGSIIGQAEDGVAKSIGNHADKDGDQRAKAEEQQIGQAALVRMKRQLRGGKAQQGQSIADMEDRERRRIVTLHNNSGSKE